VGCGKIVISFRTCQDLDTVETQLRQDAGYSSFSQALLIKSQRQVRFTPWQLQLDRPNPVVGYGVPEPECPSLSARFLFKEDLTGHCDRRDSHDLLDVFALAMVEYGEFPATL